MKIKIPGTILIDEESIILADFEMHLEGAEHAYSEDNLEKLASLVCMKWAIERMLSRIEELDVNPDPITGHLH